MQKFEHYTLTLSGSVQTLASALPADVIVPKCYGVWIQPAGGNTNVIYVGGKNVTITSSNYAFRLEAPAATIPPAPFSFGDFFPYGAIDLEAIRVLGTNNEKLQIGLIPFAE